ncbi:MAG: DUF6198 family protein [Spirochaetales bacterium]|nr:DUF6198 family protein [Spirochaetales bacterium]
MNKQNIFLRLFEFTLGLFFVAFAISLSVKANLGVSPISCIPYILSQKISLSLGKMTIIFNSFLILLQILILRKKYKLFQLVQLPVVFVLGFFVDLTSFIISSWQFDTYFVRLLICLLSCFILALGVYLEVIAKVTYLAGEGVAVAICTVTNIEFGKSKIIVDSSMVIIGVILSFLFFKKLIGAREGTIFAAILVGMIVKLYTKLIQKINHT